VQPTTPEEVAAALVRILLVGATLLGFGAGAVIYLACWLIVPEER
jgi:phage shock protein PspC (stress-responsive transcriptional regulator)